MTYVRQCDYCKKNIEARKGYYYITAKPRGTESHMCRTCWMNKARGIRVKKLYLLR